MHLPGSRRMFGLLVNSFSEWWAAEKEGEQSVPTHASICCWGRKQVLRGWRWWVLLLVGAPRSTEESDLYAEGVKVVDADCCGWLLSYLGPAFDMQSLWVIPGQERGNCHMEIIAPQVPQLLSKSTFKLSSWQPQWLCRNVISRLPTPHTPFRSTEGDKYLQAARVSWCKYRFLPVTYLSLAMALHGEEGWDVPLLCKLLCLAAVSPSLNSCEDRLFLHTNASWETDKRRHLGLSEINIYYLPF